ncbi:MAG: alginate export family protein [Pseudomonadota bacterium]
MKCRLIMRCGVLLVAGTLTAPLLADTSQQQDQEVLDWSFDFRARAANISQDNALQDADPLTARLRAGITWTSHADWQVLADIDAVADLAGDYNSTTNGKTTFSIEADPDTVELNRAQVAFTGISDTVVTVGRQRMRYDNMRFIGNTPWRQNEQTFDAARIDWSGIDKSTLSVAWLDKQHRPVGDDNPGGNVQLSAPLFNWRYEALPNTKLLAYGYFIGFDDQPTRSQRTLGFKIERRSTVRKVVLTYSFERAVQDPYRDGLSTNEGNYRKLLLAAKWRGVTATLAQEVLSGDGIYGFSTPLSSLHGPNGWADVFLPATPLNGLDDRFFSVGGKVAGFNLLGRYHDFRADNGSADYGSEIDLLVSRKFGGALKDKLTATLKFARYDAKEFGVDTTKVWLFADYRWR